MDSQEFFKLFKLEKQASHEKTFNLSYKSFFALNDTQISLTALPDNLFEIIVKTPEFGGKMEEINIILNLSQKDISLELEEPMLNEIFPFLIFASESIKNDLTFLSGIIYNILIPKYELTSSISYYGDSRV